MIECFTYILNRCVYELFIVKVGCVLCKKIAEKLPEISNLKSDDTRLYHSNLRFIN